MKKSFLFIIAVAVLLCVMSVVSFADAADTSKLKFDKDGNPTHDENGKPLLFGIKISDGSYVYIREDGSAVVTGVEEIEYPDWFDDYAKSITSVYFDPSLKNIGGDTFGKFSSCKSYSIPTSVQYIGMNSFGNSANKDVSVDFYGKKGQLLVVDEGNEAIFSEKLLNAFQKVLFVHKDGIRYYVNGVSAAGFTQVEGMTVYFSRVTGLLNTKQVLKIGGVPHYFNDDYTVKHGEDILNGKLCLFDMGKIQTGWKDLDGDGKTESYFRYNNGSKVTGDECIGGKVYGYSDGKLTLKNGLAQINGKTYYCVNGEKQDGYIDIEGKTYYFLRYTKERVEADTYTLCGFRRDFNPDHSINPISGWQYKDGKIYYYIDGQAATGFTKIDGYTYYFYKSDHVYGEMASGWTIIGGEPYYFYPEGNENHGRAAVGRQNVNGKVYYFNSNGSVNTGSVTGADGNIYYYYQTEKLRGWHKISGKVYYFTKEFGYMVTGEKYIDGEKYIFDVNGVLLSPEHEAPELGSSNGTGGNGFDIGGDGWSDIEFI